jgi:hypothetical protein
MMTKAQATKAAKALYKRMKGGPWAIRVHENLGWHYSVETKRLRVCGPSYTGEKTFMCLLKPHYSGFGIVGHHTDPNKAVAMTVRSAIPYYEEMARIIAEARAESGI